ncbi:MAG: blue-light-activated histidine kinase 1 [Caulobacter sp.]|nr:blue-light-activated histidine kinase 1 [Caulobacter sp.]
MPRIVDKSQGQKNAEADVQRFRADLGPFVVAAETTRMAMVFADARDPEHPIIFANDSFLALTGYDREEVLGQSFNFLLEQGEEGDAVARVAAEFSGAATAATEVFYHRKDGAPFWTAIFITPVRDAQGEVVQYFASFIDLSVHKEEEALSRMLIDELNHRVKNTLATVRSIVAQGLRTSEDIEAVREAIEARLFALSRSHDLLARENWRGAELRDLVMEALEPFGAGGGGAERIEVDGDSVRLKPNVALALGIAFHELATNAVKYGALSEAAGSVRLSWTIEASERGERLHLRWREQGGPPVTPPTRKGFGSRVIERGLSHELRARTHLDYDRAGLVCTIDMPAPDEDRET